VERLAAWLDLASCCESPLAASDILTERIGEQTPPPASALPLDMATATAPAQLAVSVQVAAKQLDRGTDLDQLGKVRAGSLHLGVILVLEVAGFAFALLTLPAQESLNRIGAAHTVGHGRVYEPTTR
jgi:hypothetical protein